MQQLVAQVPWGHNIVLMEKIKDKEIRKIYAEDINLHLEIEEDGEEDE